MDSFFSEIGTRLQAGQAVALAAIVQGHGSAPRKAGAFMAVFSDGSAAGTVGGGALEYQVQQQAAHCLRQQHSMLLPFKLQANDAAGLGMVCGGQVTVAVLYLPAGGEAASLADALARAQAGRHRSWLVLRWAGESNWALALADADGNQAHLLGQAPPLAPSLLAGKLKAVPTDGVEAGLQWYALPLGNDGHAIVFGAGHVSLQLVPLLHRLSFECTVVDDRAEFANAQRFPQAESIQVCAFPDAFPTLIAGTRDAVVALTRGHLYDTDVMAWALGTSAGYIGMIGSKAKIQHCKAALVEQHGIAPAQLSRIHAPIGLPIGGQTPEEIALSIAAELVAFRHGKLPVPL